MNSTPLLLFLLFASLLTGCGTITSKPISLEGFGEKNVALEQHRRLANRYSEQLDFHAALIQWQIVLALDPQTQDAQRQIELAQHKLSVAIASELSTARNLDNAGNIAQAAHHYLKALALSPDNEEAINFLRNIETQDERRVQIARSEQQLQQHTVGKNGSGSKGDTLSEEEQYYLDSGINLLNVGDYINAITELQKSLSASPNDDRAKNRLGNAYLKAGLNQLNSGDAQAAHNYLTQAKALLGAANPELNRHIKTARLALGKQYYKEGMRFFRSDIEKAIKNLNASLNFDPDNVQTRIQLKNAQRMQSQLDNINSSN